MGIAASDGIAIGKAYLLTEPDLTFAKKTIDNPEGEITRLLDSFENAFQHGLRRASKVERLWPLMPRMQPCSPVGFSVSGPGDGSG